MNEKHLIIVHAEAFGKAQEHELFKPMVEGTRENFREIGREEDVFERAKLVADSGFHKEENMKMLMEEGIDGYVADPHFRKRDPRFWEVGKYKERFNKEGAEYFGTTSLKQTFSTDSLCSE